MKRMDFNDAKSYCQSRHNSELLIISTSYQNQFIRDYYAFFDYVWLNAEIVESNDSFITTTKNQLKWKGKNIIHYTNFANGYSVTSGDKYKSCLRMNKVGEWENVDCHGYASFVCQKRLVVEEDDVVECPGGWTFSKFTGTCYKVIFKKNLSLTRADKICREQGFLVGEVSTLASIQSQEENNIVLNLALLKQSHLHKILLGGLNDSKKKSRWFWIDGSKLTFQNWDDFMPRGSSKLSGICMSPSGKWSSMSTEKVSHPDHTVAVCKFIPTI
uniref:C-type lectin domain-containing protein n=1 Tax=Rhabditophanes sp. KR3021 TaxID=114890 RepID=A0AC35TKW7_9BILA